MSTYIRVQNSTKSNLDNVGNNLVKSGDVDAKDVTYDLIVNYLLKKQEVQA